VHLRNIDCNQSVRKRTVETRGSPRLIPFLPSLTAQPLVSARPGQLLREVAQLRPLGLCLGFLPLPEFSQSSAFRRIGAGPEGNHVGNCSGVQCTLSASGVGRSLLGVRAETGKFALPLGLNFWYYTFMAKSNKVVPKKKRGRPATGRDPVTAIRLSAEMRESVDAWAALQDGEPGRSEAIRRLVELGLKAKTNRPRNA